MRSMFTTLLMILVVSLSAQQFATMINNDNVAFLREFKITTVDGKTYEADKLSSYQAANGRINALTIKTADGEKHKFKANEIQELTAKLTKFAKATTIADNATKSISSAVNTNYAEIIKNNLVRFNSVEFNKKKGKKALLQLVNYGFDQNFKVYPDPNSESGVTSVNGIDVSGGEIKSYFVVQGDKTYTVNKKSYKKEYDEIYNGCEAMKTDAKSISIKNLCDDILKYNSECGE